MLGVKLKRVLGSRVFWASVILYAVIMILGVQEDLPRARDNSVSVLYFYLVTTSVGITHVLISVITILPFVFFYVEELEKKSEYYNLIRSSKKEYYLANVFTAIISSVLVSALALLLFCMVCLAFGANFHVDPSVGSYYEGMFFGPWMENDRLIPVLLVHMLVFLAASTPWGVLCMAISIFSKNKYVIIAFPFILRTAANLITDLTALHMLSPGVMLLKGSVILRMPYGGFFYALGYHMVFVAAFSIFYYAMSKRRFRHEGI